MPESNIDSPVQPCGNKPPPPTPKKPDKKHFVSFKIVDDKGTPVEDVVLLIKLPDGSKEEHTTDEDGMITINGITAGSCHIIADWRKETAEDMVMIQS